MYNRADYNESIGHVVMIGWLISGAISQVLWIP